MSTYDYGNYVAGPSAEAVAIRDHLAEEFFVAFAARTEAHAALAANLKSHPHETKALERALTRASKIQDRTEERLVLHLLAHLPVADFVTASGKSFAVRPVMPKPKVREGKTGRARTWLRGRNARDLALKLIRQGRDLSTPPHWRYECGRSRATDSFALISGYT